MYVIFCVTGYEGQTWVGDHLNKNWVLDEYTEYVDARFAAAWRQVAERFKDYDERVIFEANNEPHMDFDPYWEKYGNLTAASEILTKRINEMNHIFVDAVRETGGNNDKRLLLLTPSFQINLVDGMDLPNDNYIGVAPHYYECGFWESWDKNDDYARHVVDAYVDDIRTFMKETGVPVVITEGAIMDLMPYSDKLDLADYSVNKFMELGVPWIWYEIDDDGTAQGHNPALYHWRDKRWVQPELRDILLRPTGRPVIPEIPITSIRINALAIETVSRGLVKQFTLTLNEGASDANVVWTIANPALATVTDDGVVTVKNVIGTVILKATDPESGLSASILLRIAS
jgi:hypothetical protein